MDIRVYRSFLQELIGDALEHSDGSVSEIAAYLHTRKVSGLLVRNKKEKKRALQDARNAFDEHRHWPLRIVISHLGLDPDELGVESF